MYQQRMAVVPTSLHRHLALMDKVVLATPMNMVAVLMEKLLPGKDSFPQLKYQVLKLIFSLLDLSTLGTFLKSLLVVSN